MTDIVNKIIHTGMVQKNLNGCKVRNENAFVDYVFKGTVPQDF